MVTLTTSLTLSLGSPPPAPPTLIPSPTHTLSYLHPDRGSLQLTHPWPTPSYCSWVEGDIKARTMLTRARVWVFSITIGQQTETPQTHGGFEEPGGEVARGRSSLDNEHTALSAPQTMTLSTKCPRHIGTGPGTHSKAFYRPRELTVQTESLLGTETLAHHISETQAQQCTHLLTRIRHG